MAVLHGGHQSGVNALSVAAMSANRVLVLSGGDDQSLHAALLEFTVAPDKALTRRPSSPPGAAQDDGDDARQPADPFTPHAEASHGGASAATGAEQGQKGPDAAPDGEATVANGHGDSRAAGAAAAADCAGDHDPIPERGLKGYAAAVDAQTRRAVLESLAGAMEAGAAANGATTRCAQHVGGMRLLGSCRVANAHASALRGAWTDGSRAVSVGLDQRVRIWGIVMQDRRSQSVDPTAAAPADAVDDSSLRGPLTAVDGAADAPETGSDSAEAAVGTRQADGNSAHQDCAMLDIREEDCGFTQVLEPEDMAVVGTRQTSGDLQDTEGQRHGVLTIAVVGRGTEVLRYDSERRSFLPLEV